MCVCNGGTKVCCGCVCTCSKEDTCANCERKQPVPHKHAELIIAWANGAIIQCHRGSGVVPLWGDIKGAPDWEAPYRYRIKPGVKPDIIRFARAGHCEYDPNTSAGQELNRQMTGTWWTIYPSGGDNLKATFDGETGKLKSVEIL